MAYSPTNVRKNPGHYLLARRVLSCSFCRFSRYHCPRRKSLSALAELRYRPRRTPPPANPSLPICRTRITFSLRLRSQMPTCAFRYLAPFLLFPLSAASGEFLRLAASRLLLSWLLPTNLLKQRRRFIMSLQKCRRLL